MTTIHDEPPSWRDFIQMLLDDKDAEIARLRVIQFTLMAELREARATIADLTKVLRGAIETMKHANRDAFCNGVVHEGRDEGDVLAGQVIDRGLAALAKAGGKE